MPLPDDFLESRDQVPRPGDLPAARESMPLPGDFLAPRDQVPRPGDLPGTRDEVALPRNLPSPVGQAGGRGNLPSPVGQVGGRGNLPASRTAAPAPPAPPDEAAAAAFDPFASDFRESASTPLAPLDFGGGGPPTPPTLTPGVALEDRHGFGLELEGGLPGENEDTGSRQVRFTLPTAHSGDDELEPLAPVTARRRGGAQREYTGAAPARRRNLVIGGVGAVVLGAAAVVTVLSLRKAEPGPDEVLKAFSSDLGRDVYQGYQRAADRLLEVNGRRPDAVSLRAAAAEQLLIAYLAHGAEKAKLSQAEQLTNALPAEDKPAPAVVRARALLTVAKGKAGEAAGLLGEEATTAEGALVLGLRDLWLGKLDAAAGALRRYCAARPDRVLGHFLLGRALEGSRPADAFKEFRTALARNPAHFGSALGVARLTDDPPQRLATLQKLMETSPTGVPRGEMAEGFVELGRAAQTVGRGADALAAFTRALGSDPQNAAANIALGEAYMLEGRYVDALQRFQATGTAGLRISAAKFGLGGALLATGMTEQGMAQIRQAAQENPKDPRGLHYTGFAAEIGRPADLEAAAQDYRAALKLDRTFLPATLRLAALMERQGRPEEALVVLKQAQDAGAPGAALQIAWGEALIVARQPARAEEVFRKAVADSPKDAPPHLGLAAALDAQGKTDLARQVLEEAAADLPQALTVRDKLAAIEAKLGHKDEAIAHYKVEIASGSAPPSARVALAKLALDVGRLDEAKEELDKVTEENPQTPDALYTLARLWEAKHDLAKALQEYRRALRFDNTPAIQLSFARALIRAGKEGEAMAALDAAAIVPEGLIERGKLLFRRGEYDRALSDFEGAAKMSPRDPNALLWVGASRDKLGNTEGAMEAWKSALRLAPDDSETHYRLGRSELDKGKIASSLDHLRRSAARAPEQADWKAELYFQLGTAEATGGSRGAAVAAFKKYLDLAPSDAPARPAVEKQIQRMSYR
jgi:tetratricopeptide (TPR) repeat protein